MLEVNKTKAAVWVRKMRKKQRCTYSLERVMVICFKHLKLQLEKNRKETAQGALPAQKDAMSSSLKMKTML